MSENKITTKQRLQIDRQHMPEREPDVRNRDFQEVNLGFSEQLVMLEARRCLLCKKPKCIDGCPVQVDIPGFIGLTAEGKFLEAAKLLSRDNSLPAVAGRVCPQEIQCEQKCVRAVKGESVAIGHIERFIADYARSDAQPETRDSTTIEPSGFRVAVIGSGPAGLTAAGRLVKMGHDVTIFEAFHRPGGVLIYGIPEFRLPNSVVDAEIDRLKDRGVKIQCNVVVGKSYSLEELLQEEGFHAAFIAVGAGLPMFMKVPGENLKGVYTSNEYLTRINLMQAYRNETPTPIIRGKKVAVIGGGNTAMDSVRTAKRLGATRAMICYRRSDAEMPARIEEIKHAKEEGIEFHLLVAPVRVLGTEDHWVHGIEFAKMQLGEPGPDGRRRVTPIEGSNFTFDCDTVVVAIGTRANPLLTQSSSDLTLNRWGYIETDETGQTNLPGVFAGGDIVRGSATVILAMGDGRTAADAIDNYLSILK